MLAIITSHPIQYQAPLWRELALAGVKFEVWFLTRHAVKASFDPGFGATFAWDLNLLEGYPNRFLPVAEGWRLDRFFGIRLRTRWADEFRDRGVTHIWVEGWRFFELWLAVRAAHAGGLQVWLRGETHDLAPKRGVRHALKRQILGWLFRRVNNFLCIGHANRRFYVGFGISPDRLSPAPYCIDNARFSSTAIELRSRRAELRTGWGISPESYVALFCGKLVEKKHPIDLVKAARIVPVVAGRPLHLLFAGDGELAPALRNAFAAPDTPPGTITGFLNQTEIPRAFAVADCLVLPSDYGETWGLVVNEALASGLPAIVSNHCGCAEDLAAPLGPECVFQFGDPVALARSLVQIAARPPTPVLMSNVIEAHAPARTVEVVKTLLAESSI